jgi:hypothetical protein
VAPTGQTTGTGGIGFPVAADQRNGGDATGGSTGAGGGGGGAGVIRLDVGTMIGTGQTSPAPTTLR